MWKATKSSDFKYWEYVLVYVDYVLWISEHPEKVMDTIKIVYRLKEYATGKIYGPQERYIWSNIRKTTLEDGEYYRYMSPYEYTEEAINNVNTELKKSGKIQNNNVKGPMDSGYQPELDVSL